MDAQSASPAPVDIPAGYYAVKSATGNNDLDFFRVDRPDKGRWAGYTFVNRVIGGRAGVLRMNRDNQNAAKLAIMDAGIDAAGNLFAAELGRCRDCGLPLTDDESRAASRGPVCRSK